MKTYQSLSVFEAVNNRNFALNRIEQISIYKLITFLNSKINDTNSKFIKRT